MTTNQCKPCGGQFSECDVDDTGTDPNTGCVVQPDGTTLCPETEVCGIWDLTEGDDNCIINDYVDQSLLLSGAPINVHKLLGVKEQGSLTDLSGTGAAISSSYLGNFPPSNAFNRYDTEWRSAETGTDVTTQAFVGYDFGPIRMENGRLRYGIETYVKKDIATIKIVQGCNQQNRVTKVRVERSEDGKKWYGVALLDVTDCEGMVTLSFKASVPSRYWRLRPVKFNGGADDYWSVRAFQLMEYEATTVTNIQDQFWLENRDRGYQIDPIRIKGSYTPPDRQSANSRWGMLFDLDAYIIEVSFRSVVKAIGRPFVIGDIIQLPSETQYSTDMTPRLAYFEVTDVGWSSTSYTPLWKPTLQKITAKPAFASQETQDIFGDLTRKLDDTGLFDIDNGNAAKYQDYNDISQRTKAEVNTAVPENGVDYADVLKFSNEVIEWGDKVGKNMRRYDRNRSIYGIDAMPPNGEKYTQGDELPPITKAKDGAYHRLTYTYLPKGNTIPARLFRFSAKKNKWIFLERDHRAEIKDAAPVLQDYLNPETSSVTPVDKITDELMKKD